MNESLKIFCDGGSRGNPGNAASAFVVERKGKVIYSDAIYLGTATNNVAEYNGVIHALKWLNKNVNLIPAKIFFILDSELVVRQILGKYKVKNSELIILHGVVAGLLKKIKSAGKDIFFESVEREKNKKPDFLVNQKLDSLL